MKKLFFLFSLLLGVLFIACDNENNIKPEATNTILGQNLASILITKPDTAKSVSLEKAKIVAAKFINNRYPESRSNNRAIQDVNSVVVDGDPLMYIVNFSNNAGFVIVSAKKGYYPILAQGNEGNFNMTDTCSPAYHWLQNQKIQVIYRQELPDSVKLEIANLWSEYNSSESIVSSRASYIEKPQVYYDSLRKWSMEGIYKVYLYNDYIQSEEYQKLSESQKNEMEMGIMVNGNSNYGSVEDVTIVLTRDIYHPNKYPTQLLNTVWGQNSPYNASDPKLRALGCTTIAAAQIMKFHEWPTYYNWAGMPTNFVTDTLQDFLYKLSQTIGVDSETRGATIDQVHSALEKNNYTVVQQKHSISKILSNLESHKPILMTGTGTGGHAWVCDGADIYSSEHEIRVMTLDYRPIADIIPTEMVEAYKVTQPIYSSGYRLHMNWGWSGQADAFYLDSNMKPKVGDTQYDFNSNRRELLISPKK